MYNVPTHSRIQNYEKKGINMIMGESLYDNSAGVREICCVSTALETRFTSIQVMLLIKFLEFNDLEKNVLKNVFGVLFFLW